MTKTGQILAVGLFAILGFALFLALAVAIVGAVVFFGSMALHAWVHEDIPALGWWQSVIGGVVVSVVFKVLTK